MHIKTDVTESASQCQPPKTYTSLKSFKNTDQTSPHLQFCLSDPIHRLSLKIIKSYSEVSEVLHAYVGGSIEFGLDKFNKMMESFTCVSEEDQHQRWAGRGT